MPEYMITAGLDTSLPYQHELKLLINMWVTPLAQSHHGRADACCTCYLKGIL